MNIDLIKKIIDNKISKGLDKNLPDAHVFGWWRKICLMLQNMVMSLEIQHHFLNINLKIVVSIIQNNGFKN